MLSSAVSRIADKLSGVDSPLTVNNNNNNNPGETFQREYISSVVSVNMSIKDNIWTLMSSHCQVI